MTDKLALRRRLNRPVPVAALAAWQDELFAAFDVDPSSPTRWEKLAMRLAIELFPKCATAGPQPRGRPITRDKVMALLGAFERFEQHKPRKKNKTFFDDHKAEWLALGINSIDAMKGAMRKARRQSRESERILTRYGAQRALGLYGPPLLECLLSAPLAEPERTLSGVKIAAE